MGAIIVGTILFGVYLIISVLFIEKKKPPVQKNRYDSIFEELERCKQEIDDEENNKTKKGGLGNQ